MTPLKASLVRLGLGLTAIGSLAVGLWPARGATFDPEKALAFGTALILWAFAEFYTPGDEAIKATTAEPAEHDRVLAKKLYGIANDDHINFIKQHDFGGTWRKEWLEPSHELAHELGKVTAEFEDHDLEKQRQKVKQLANAFSNYMSLNSWAVGGVVLFSMIPERERGDQWSARTTESVKTANKAADELAEALEELFRLVRRKGIAVREPT